jgi:hypothetical protein
MYLAAQFVATMVTTAGGIAYPALGHNNHSSAKTARKGYRK